MNKNLKIVLTGAESTGKSTLAKQLANHYQTQWIPELARDYVENLGRKYTYNDIEAIARKQLEIEKQLKLMHPAVFFDTWLIITKVWFDFVYGKHPIWLYNAIKNSNIDLFLVCNIDMPWEADPVRENGGENRQKLHSIYLNELNHFAFKYIIIDGTGDVRLKNAIEAIDHYLATPND